MSWELKTAKVQRVTKALAQRIFSMTPAPGDRPLSDRRLAIYRTMVEQGTFRPCTWAIAIAAETGETFRVNGKHTSTLFSQLDELPELYITLEEYLCDTVQDVARLYGTFDPRTATRTAREINRAFASAIPELADVRIKVIDVAVTGMAWFLYRADAYLKTSAERAELLEVNKPFVLWLDDVIGSDYNKQAKHILRGTVCSAMFATFQKSQRDSTDFWLAVRDETGDKPTLPDRKLAKYLSVTSMGHNTAGKKRSTTAVETYAKCLHAWNAWRRKESTDLKFYPGKKLPEAK